MHLVMPPSLPVAFSVHLSPDLVVLVGRGGSGRGWETLSGPLEAGGAARHAAGRCPPPPGLLCGAQLLTQQMNRTSKSQKRARGFVPAALLRTWCVSLICFYLGVAYLLLGVLVFSSPVPAARVDSDFLRISPPIPRLPPTAAGASELLAQSHRFCRVSGQMRPRVPATARRGRKPIAIRSVATLMKRIDV